MSSTSAKFQPAVESFHFKIGWFRSVGVYVSLLRISGYFLRLDSSWRSGGFKGLQRGSVLKRRLYGTTTWMIEGIIGSVQDLSMELRYWADSVLSVGQGIVI